jgi:hypothetical protein
VQAKNDNFFINIIKHNRKKGLKSSVLPVLHRVNKDQFQQPTDEKYKSKWLDKKKIYTHKIQVTMRNRQAERKRDTM